MPAAGSVLRMAAAGELSPNRLRVIDYLKTGYTGNSDRPPDLAGVLQHLIFGSRYTPDSEAAAA